jgi:undecaprenyl-diphosphatase
VVVCGVFWLALAIGFLVMAGFAANRDYFPADLRIEHWLQAQDRPGVGGTLRVPNVLGDGIGTVSILALILLATVVYRRFTETILFLSVVVPRAAQVATKALVERPRPSPDLVQVTEHNSDWSFPSGHVMGIVAVFGLVLFLAPSLIPNRPLRLLVQAFSLFMILAVGPARVYVGAHWPSDVLGSYVLGVLFLVPAVWAHRTFLPRWVDLAQRRVKALVRPQTL